MPFVTVKILKGRDLEAKRELVRKVTDAVCEAIDLKPETVTVVIEECEREDWAVGGRLFSDR
ncbi:MAG: 4-oxalocrotonate tautomerase family protein [Rhodospirillales bacterium]|jgi:4-oxalocrotonate tautomerase|nr:4-oxalocrotonate tautomerase family protein [Rhodospirillales bacterium]